MLNFEYSQPTNIIFGKDTHLQVGKYVKQYGGTNILVHFGSDRIKQNGLLAQVEASLTNSGVKYTLLGGVEPNPRLALIHQGIEICKQKKIDFILAVGGGSPIDSAKGIAAGAMYDGDVWDFYMKTAEFDTALPVATILTIAAAGSEASTGSVVTNKETGYKRDINHACLIPQFSILNPQLTMSVSPYQTSCGSVDIMMHTLERYFTLTKNVAFTDRLCEGVLLNMIEQATLVLKNPDDYNARAEIMWAGTIAHNNLLSTGRVGDWASHMMGHELGALYDIAHGATLSIIFPAWMTYVYKQDINRFKQFAVRVMGVDPTVLSEEEIALEGIKRIKAFFKSLGMPTSFADVDKDERDIATMAKKTQIFGPIANFMTLDTNDVTAIYKLAL